MFEGWWYGVEFRVKTLSELSSISYAALVKSKTRRALKKDFATLYWTGSAKIILGLPPQLRT